ncbi:MAG: type II secretion system F family protein [Candidatus Sericytochromatia bacterium]|nr:type II secretion system F family protein [Candidatus Sericytochromatia bacterium]
MNLRLQLEPRLVMAGCFGKRALAVTVGIKVLLTVVGAAFGWAFGPVWGLAGGLAGCLAPDLWLRQTTQKRQQQIILALPNAMDMLAISVEAGLTLDAALQRFSARESPSSRALCQEMRLFLKDVQLGQSRADAYADFGRRSGVQDLRLLAAALYQADRWGVEMTNVMRIQADHLRTRRLQRAEEQAMKAPIKILMPLVFFVFPAIFVILLGPAAMQLGRLFP